MPTAATTAAAAFIAVRYQEGQDFSAIKRRHVNVGITKSFPRHRRRNHNIRSILYASETNSAEDDDVENEVKKSLSPLAMAAADWLEEEEDELAMYWDRYDVAKKNSNSSKEQTLPSTPPSQSQQDQDDNDSTTTEERLDRYYQSRNIDRGIERQHSTQIKQAIEKSKKASSADEAIQLLLPIRQYLQYNTKLGGNAYFELAQALDANGQVEEATDIYETLACSPHADFRQKSRELLAMGSSSRRKRTYNRNVWNWFWDV